MRLYKCIFIKHFANNDKRLRRLEGKCKLALFTYSGFIFVNNMTRVAIFECLEFQGRV